MLTIAAALMSACHRTPKAPSRDELFHTIDSIQTPLMEQAYTSSIDTVEGRRIVDLYIQFADSFPSDTLAATYIARAAMVCNGMGLVDEMCRYFDRVIDQYPDYEHLDECYYVKGLALDNAGRKDEAREVYKAFLELFPDHFLADDIRKALPLLDKSDEWLTNNLLNN